MCRVLWNCIQVQMKIKSKRKIHLANKQEKGKTTKKCASKRTKAPKGGKLNFSRVCLCVHLCVSEWATGDGQTIAIVKEEEKKTWIGRVNVEKKQRQKQKRHQNNKQAAQNARLIIILLALLLPLYLSLSRASQRLWALSKSAFGCGWWQHFPLTAPAFTSSSFFYDFSAFLLLCALYCFDFALFLVSGLCSSLSLLLCEKPKRSHGTFNPLLPTFTVW